MMMVVSYYVYWKYHSTTSDTIFYPEIIFNLNHLHNNDNNLKHLPNVSHFPRKIGLWETGESPNFQALSWKNL